MAKHKHKKTSSKTKKQPTKPKNKGLEITIITIIVIGLGIYFFFNFAEADEMNPIVILETNKGNIKIELDKENAPITTQNFLEYVEQGHYDGLIFHRVMQGFMIQGGGFTPEGQQKPTNPPIKLESNNGLKNTIGTIAMARTPIPDSATSQFFINTVNNNFLDYAPGNPGYAVFGKVIEGMDIVKQIEQVRTTTKNGHNDWPVEDVIIIKAYTQ
jgi:peptidyl-prolyl cis-trans isomerase A (cyclophilin A)